MSDEPLTVAQLIAKLHDLPADAPVFIYEGGVHDAELYESGRYVYLATDHGGTP